MPSLLTSLWVPTQNLHILFNHMLSSIIMMMSKKKTKTNVNLKITINYISFNRTWCNRLLMASNICDPYCANYCSYITLCLVKGNFFLRTNGSLHEQVMLSFSRCWPSAQVHTRPAGVARHRAEGLQPPWFTEHWLLPAGKHKER